MISFTRLSNGDFQLHARQVVQRPIEKVFSFFSEASNLELLTPTFLNFKILTKLPIEMKVGTLIDYRIWLRMVPLVWRSEITVWNPPHEFVDFQIKGPYRKWHHLHRFIEVNEGTLVEDIVTYNVYGGSIIEKFFVRADLERIFSYRSKVISEEKFP